MAVPDLRQLLGQMRQAQEQLQEKLSKLVIETSAGGGMITVKMNGQKQLLEVRLDPEVLRSGDREMLQDLVRAAVNEASRRVDAELQEQLLDLAGPLGNLKIPGLF